MKRFRILAMTTIVRRLWSFTAILLFSVTVKGDLVPKKLWEFDFKEKTGYDLGFIDVVHSAEETNEYSVFFTAHAKWEEGIGRTQYDFWVTNDGNVFETYELYNSQNVIVLNMSHKSLVIYGGKRIIRLEDKNGDLSLRKFNLPNGRGSDDAYNRGDDRIILAKNGNKIICYDPVNWVESEGGNSEPQIMFSKITPNEVTIEGETTKGGTIERSTDLKNWKKLVRVSKGGFELFVDPTEKNKEFFRVKSE
jgi:hypothetical protein